MAVNPFNKDGMMHLPSYNDALTSSNETPFYQKHERSYNKRPPDELGYEDNSADNTDPFLKYRGLKTQLTRELGNLMKRRNCFAKRAMLKSIKFRKPIPPYFFGIRRSHLCQ